MQTTKWDGYVIQDDGEVFISTNKYAPKLQQSERVKDQIIQETQKKLWEAEEAIIRWESFRKKRPELHSGEVMLELAQSIQARCRKILADLGVDMS